MRTLMFILFFPFSFSGHNGGKELLDVALGKCERLESLEDYRDILSRYGMTDKLPLACPLKDKFRISSAYGGRIHPVTKKTQFHSGIDMAVELAAPVYTTASGTVTFAGRKGGYEDVSLYGIFTALKRCMLIWPRITPQKEKNS